MMGTTLKAGRATTWVVSGFAVAVLIVSLACVGWAFTAVIGWWAPGLAVVVAIAVVALAIQKFRRDPSSLAR